METQYMFRVYNNPRECAAITQNESLMKALQTRLFISLYTSHCKTTLLQ